MIKLYLRYILAIILFRLGFKYRSSTGINKGEITCGYGKLDNWGYWQFPLFEDGLAIDKTFISFKSKNQGPLIMCIKESWTEGKVFYAKVLWSFDIKIEIRRG